MLVRVHCSLCGEVELAASAVALIAHEDGTDDVYAFTCPRCGAHYSRCVTARVRSILIAAGVTAIIAPVRAHHGDAPPLTNDDLIDLHFDLERFDHGESA